MSAGGAFGGNRGLRPVPPEKGIFPLDHMHECDLEKQDYLNCLKSSGHKSERCRHLSKKYLQCRMERVMMKSVATMCSHGSDKIKWHYVVSNRNLMAKQDMSELGFGKEAEMQTTGKMKNDE